jgi:hypothetical protein
MMHRGYKTTWRWLVAALLVLVTVGGLFTAQSAAAAPTGEGIDLGNMGNTAEPAEGISPDGTLVCAVWGTYDQGDSNAVYVRLYNTATGAVSPANAYQLASASDIGKAHCAIDAKGNVHTVWQQKGNDGQQISYRMLPAGSDPSNGWTSPYTIQTNRDGPDIDALYADTNGQVWLAYRLYQGQFEVRNWANGSWSGPQSVSADAGADKVRIGVDNAGYVNLTWRDGNNGVGYAYRNPSTGQFSGKYVIPGSNGAGLSSIAVDKNSGDVNITYPKNFTELHYVKGGRGGTNFSDRIVATGTNAILQPRIAWSANGRLIIAYDDNNKANISAITSENNGANWGSPSAIATPGGGAQAPWVVADTAGGAYILYAHTNGARVYLTTLAGTGGGTGGGGGTPTVTKPVISGVGSTPNTLTSATVTWKTDVIASSRVFYTENPNPVVEDASPSVGDPNQVTSHSITLRGLKPGTTYNYIVRTANDAGVTVDTTTRSFTTPDIEIVGTGESYDGHFAALVAPPAGTTKAEWFSSSDNYATSHLIFAGAATIGRTVFGFASDVTPGAEQGATTFQILVRYNGNPALQSTVSLNYNPGFRPVFSDIGYPPTSAYGAAIYELAGRGIVNGYAADTCAARGLAAPCFGPIDPVARAEAAALVARALTWSGEHGVNNFSDQGPVDDALWNDVNVLADRGIARGFGDGTYNPTGQVTQGQMISLIARAMVAKGYWQNQPDTGCLSTVPATGQDRQDIVNYCHYVPDLASFFSASNYTVSAERRVVALFVWRAIQWRETASASAAALYEIP